MDPRSATITATEIVVNAIKAAQTYSDYQSKRKNATISLLSLIAECNCVSVALHQIHDALRTNPSIASRLTAEDDASGKTFNSVLAACQVTFRELFQQASKYNELTTDTENPFGLTSRRHKAKLVWNDKDIQSISRNVSGIVGGLNLLLQALSFKSTLEIHSQLADRRSSIVAEQLADDAISLVSSHHSGGSWSLLDYRQSMTDLSRPGSSWSLMGLALADATLSSSIGDIHYLSLVDTEFITQVTKALKQEQGHTIIGVSDNMLNSETRRLAIESPDGFSIALTHRKLKIIPHEWIDLVRTRLERLAISHNELTALPASIGLCSRLSYLNLRYNSFRKIPDCVFDIQSLRILDVSRNRIVEIQDNIASLKNLEILDIDDNEIQLLPRCIGFMASLHSIKNIKGNPLLEPPQSLLNKLIAPDVSLADSSGVFADQTPFIKDYLMNSTLVSQDRSGHVILCLRCGRALGYSHEGQYTVVLLTVPFWKLLNREAAKCSSCVTRSIWRFAGLVGNESICVACVQKRWPLACCGYCDKV